MRVEVTRRHIEAGCRGSAKACPVAMAIRETQGVFDCTLGRSKVSIEEKDGWTRYATGPQLRRWLRDYDDGYDVPSMAVVFCYGVTDEQNRAEAVINSHVMLTD